MALVTCYINKAYQLEGCRCQDLYFGGRKIRYEEKHLHIAFLVEIFVVVARVIKGGGENYIFSLVYTGLKVSDL
jgi:hypothetical protein